MKIDPRLLTLPCSSQFHRQALHSREMTIIKATLALLTVLFIVAAEECQQTGYYCPCKLYLAPSRALGFGRGVIAGKDFSVDELVDRAPTIVIANEVTDDLMLHNYIYCSEDDLFGMITFGPAVIFNHKPSDEKDVQHRWTEYEVPTIDQQLKSPNTIYSDVENTATKMILAGEEIFTTYGEDNWFIDREIGFLSTNTSNQTSFKNAEGLLRDNRYTLDELKMYPCITDVFVDESNIPGAGRGLFAARDFEEGDIITVSPIALIPSESVENSYEDSVLVNFCFTCGEQYDFVIFPMGLLAMANHNKEAANMNIAWYFFNGDNKTLEKSLDDIASSHFSVLDISAVATKSIRAGDELFLDYGSGWEEQFNIYAADTGKWERENNFESSAHYSLDYLLGKPQFRYAIDAPDNFCPEHWRYTEPQFLQYYYGEDYVDENFDETSSRILEKMNTGGNMVSEDDNNRGEL